MKDWDSLNQNHKLKILITTQTFPPNKDGISEAASVLAAAFLKKGWEVEVATEPFYPAREKLCWHGATLNEFHIMGQPHILYPFKGEVYAYQQFLLSGKWDAIILQGYGWPLYAALPILHKLKSRKILVSHGYYALQWIPYNKFPFGLASLFNSIVLSLQMLTWIKKIDRVVYLSKRKDWKAFYDHLLASIINHSGIKVIPNGIDSEANELVTDRFRDIYKISKDSFLFLCVANYSRRKDQGFAARAFRKAGIPNATLVFVGSDFNEWSDKFQREDAKSLHEHPKGRIIWLEKLDRESTLAAFAECNAFVLSSDHEAQPIALLEAMRESKPWIARDAGCISEMPGGVCVYSESEMVEAMGKIFCDREYRETLGRAGRSAIERLYNLESYNYSYVNLAKEITS
jgi:glycosyltransferase involved in cell wall biosynthesis